ncbi:MAG: cation diffusion facilitator family transporter, partial [Candidatus Gracilibacteria bacterium]|nr:cation diffusion facilitator family transporter [Candidatus Gracilibacteria bacterium]
MSVDGTSSNSGLIAVLSAIIGNTIITILKFFGFFITGSGSLFSESIHSLADTMNQVLLMIGIKKSSKKEDHKYSYGYKKERYIRATISACGIFFIGAGITIYHGIEGIFYPKEIEHIFYSFSILAFSFIVEGITLFIAIRSIYNKEDGLFESIKKSDNASLAVILEDSVAVSGVLIAILCIFLSYKTGISYFDNIGSIIIGIMLGFVAVFLITENKNYLIGKSIEIDLKDDIVNFLESHELIDKVLNFKSQMLDNENFIIKCEIEFNGSALTKELNRNSMFEKEYEGVKEDYIDFVKFCSYFANLIPRVMGQKINEIERE